MPDANPFRPQAPAKPRPQLSAAARAVVEKGDLIPPDHPLMGEIKNYLSHYPATKANLVDLTAQFVGELKKQDARIKKLETSLEKAIDLVETSIADDVSTFLGDAPEGIDEFSPDQQRQIMAEFKSKRSGT